MNELWNTFFGFIIRTGLPLVQCYQLICGNLFLNTAHEEAVGLEKWGNVCLAPLQYLLAGRKIEKISNHPLQYRVEPLFSYSDHFAVKTVASIIASPISLTLGVALKGAAYLSKDVRRVHEDFIAWEKEGVLESHNGEFARWGIALGPIEELEPHPLYQRHSGSENHLNGEKEALRDIIAILKKYEIIHWVDCGTCLGAYRYQGIIPWDNDIDIAILKPDFENVRRVLQELDPEKYEVQDWSGRDKPKSYLKVYAKTARALIDIYHFDVDPKAKSVTSILSNAGSIFLPDSWKVRESRYVIETPFDVVFPLKKTWFDGIEVYVPHQTKKYLQMRYGENIEPACLYNEVSGNYEKDLSHPYWQLTYVH